MKNKNLIFTVLAVALVLVIVLMLPKEKPNDQVYYGEGMDTFAKCLNESGAVEYGVYWCSACEAQEKDFGQSFQYVNYFECSDDSTTCKEKGIEYTPTWILADGEKLVGRQPLEVLAEKTGCELPQVNQ